MSPSSTRMWRGVHLAAKQHWQKGVCHWHSPEPGHRFTYSQCDVCMSIELLNSNRITAKGKTQDCALCNANYTTIDGNDKFDVLWTDQTIESKIKLIHKKEKQFLEASCEQFSNSPVHHASKRPLWCHKCRLIPWTAHKGVTRRRYACLLSLNNLAYFLKYNRANK